MKLVVPIVELLFAGLLVTIAALFVSYSWVSEGTRATLWDQALSPLIAKGNVSAVTVLAAVSYGVGVVSDFVGILLFEGLLNSIKIRRMQRYLIRNEAKLNKSHILSGLKGLTTVEIQKGWLGTSDRAKKWLNWRDPYSTDEEALLSALGNMRFYVLAKSQQLYAEIESQLWRLRFTRALVLVQLLAALGALGYLHKSLPCIVLLVGTTAVVMLANILHVQHRHKRYCRAIERAYRVLVLDNGQGVVSDSQDAELQAEDC